MNGVPQTVMILAAGLGTRMRPLTDDRPKPLVEVAGHTLIDHTLGLLKAEGVKRVIVNLHYKADMLRQHLARHDHGLDILFSDETDRLLDSGGGIKKALPLFGTQDPIISVNGDLLWAANTGIISRAWQAYNPDRMDALLMGAPVDRATGDGKQLLEVSHYFHVLPFLSLLFSSLIPFLPSQTHSSGFNPGCRPSSTTGDPTTNPQRTSPPTCTAGSLPPNPPVKTDCRSSASSPDTTNDHTHPRTSSRHARAPCVHLERKGRCASPLSHVITPQCRHVPVNRLKLYITGQVLSSACHNPTRRLQWRRWPTATRTTAPHLRGLKESNRGEDAQRGGN